MPIPASEKVSARTGKSLIRKGNGGARKNMKGVSLSNKRKHSKERPLVKEKEEGILHRTRKRVPEIRKKEGKVPFEEKKVVSMLVIRKKVKSGTAQIIELWWEILLTLRK